MKTLYLIISTILTVGCTSDDVVDPESQLPPITTTGENTFGAIINGKFFKPRDGTGTYTGTDRGLRIVSTEDVNIEFDARDFKSDRTANLLIHLENFENLGKGTYVVNASNGNKGIDGNDNSYMHCRIWNEKIGNYQGYVSFDNSGEIIIDYVEFVQDFKNIKSGRFYGKLINTRDLQDTILIKSGRFDLNSYTLRDKEFN